MVVLDASRRGQSVPRLAAWSLGAGICATVGANLAHGVEHGPVGALVSAWPALALVGSFELLMMFEGGGQNGAAGLDVVGDLVESAGGLLLAFADGLQSRFDLVLGPVGVADEVEESVFLAVEVGELLAQGTARYFGAFCRVGGGFAGDAFEGLPVDGGNGDGRVCGR